MGEPPVIRLFLLRLHRACLFRERERCYQQLAGAHAALEINDGDMRKVDAAIAVAEAERRLQRYRVQS